MFVRWINLVKEEKGVLSVISRPGGVNVVKLDFMPRYPRYLCTICTTLYLIPLFSDIHVEVNRLIGPPNLDSSI